MGLLNGVREMSEQDKGRYCFSQMNPEQLVEVSVKAGKRSGEVRRNKSFWKKLLTSEGLHQTAATDYLEQHPEAISQLTKVIHEQAIGGCTKSQSMLVSLLGLDAPKKVEQKEVKEEISAERARELLQLKVVDKDVG